MTFRDFHHALRIMLNLEPEELVAAGVIPSLDSSDFIAYNKSPFTWFIRTDDARAQKLFAMIEARLPLSKVAPPTGHGIHVSRVSAVWDPRIFWMNCDGESMGNITFGEIQMTFIWVQPLQGKAMAEPVISLLAMGKEALEGIFGWGKEAREAILRKARAVRVLHENFQAFEDWHRGIDQRLYFSIGWDGSKS